VVVTGQPGAGKSTLLNANPKLMMLDPERGGNTVQDPQALRFTPPTTVHPKDLDQAYIDFVDKLIARRMSGKTDIQMIGIDTLDEMIGIFSKSLCLRENCVDVGDVGGGHGRGYAMVREAIFGMLDKAYRAGFGWAIVAHTRTKTVMVGREERQISGLAVSDSFKAAVFQKCEHIVFVEHGVQIVEGEPTVKVVGGKRIKKAGKRQTVKVRKLKTRPGGLWQGGESNEVKVRVPLDDEMVLPERGGWDMFTAAYDRAVESLRKA